MLEMLKMIETIIDKKKDAKEKRHERKKDAKEKRHERKNDAKEKRRPEPIHFIQYYGLNIGSM